MNPQPSWNELEPYYSNGYGAYDPNHGSSASDNETIAEARQTGKLRHIPIPIAKRLLDVGCGAGRFIRIASKLGAAVQGVEPSEYAARVAQEQGLNVFCGTIEQFAAQTDAKFDVITSNHVVEHVPDPIATLTAMKSLLAPGGVIWISVPNAAYPIARALNGRWHSTDLPYHLMQFTPDSIAIAGKNAGLKVRNQTTESIPRIVEASMGQFLRYKFKIPFGVSQRAGVLGPIAKRYAASIDRRCRGEAILTEFTA